MSAPVAVIVCGPNLRDQSKGQFHIHAPSCSDVNHYGSRGPMGGEPPYQVTVWDRRFVVEHVYADQLAEGSSYEACAADVHFAPCLQGVLK